MKYPLFCTRELAPSLTADGIVIDASSQTFPYSHLSPFYVWNRVIPVPGQEGVYSRSVEGIWQGLKIIDGRTDFSLFDAERVKKRRVEPYGSCEFQLGLDRIDYRTARSSIFVVAYTWMFHNLLPESLKEHLYRTAEEDTVLYFCDIDSNPDIEDLTSSYSHASLLVDIIERELQKRSSMKH